MFFQGLFSFILMVFLSDALCSSVQDHGQRPVTSTAKHCCLLR